MKRTKKLIVASFSLGLAVVLGSAWFFYHENVSAQDQEPYSVSLNSPVRLPVDI
ncbi:MAG: hypothetical protein OXE56_10610 [Gammaproteobacteria bacterium]|nr:hypothetical protein [Gammaproteobacteria bacterium]